MKEIHLILMWYASDWISKFNEQLMEVNIDEHIPKDDYFLYSIFDHAS